jgi:hypothetical protein
MLLVDFCISFLLTIYDLSEKLIPCRLREPADGDGDAGSRHGSPLLPEEDAAVELPVQPAAVRPPPAHLPGQPGQHTGGVLPPRLSALQQVRFAQRIAQIIERKHYKSTGKKEENIFLIYKEIQKGAVAKSYMTNGLLYITLQPLPSEFPIFFFICESAYENV